MTPDRYAVIVAGGSGVRMGMEIPKQFLPFSGKPILMHTLSRFFDSDHSIHIILVLPAAQRSEWERLCREHRFTIPHSLVEGGKERFHSVKAGLERVPDYSLVAVHDGVRPFVRNEVINHSFQAAELHGGVVPVVAVSESLRLIEGGSTKALDRSKYFLVQTPQTFRSTELKQAYQQEYNHAFTDDASVYEKAGFAIHCIDGNRENIKITTSIDLAIAESLHQFLNS